MISLHSVVINRLDRVSESDSNLELNDISVSRQLEMPPTSGRKGYLLSGALSISAVL
jgi:hypothetical protein